MSSDFQKRIAVLEKHYGRPDPPAVTDPFEMILLENAAYLVSDERRLIAFERLKSDIGTSPTDILTASDEALYQAAKLGGMLPEGRIEKLRRSARIALHELRGELNASLALPLPKAKRALMKFPGIGEPSAERILLFNRSYRVLGLDSNGLRVLLRLGYGSENKNYSAAYRSATQAVTPELKDDYDWLIRAHQLLRRHGQTMCKTSAPRCPECPVARQCEYVSLQRNQILASALK
ncbi:MAG TPA: hypothetical protein VJX67_04050 [Blastocatellia bacterium]|nr:hypothetical protein [Blastocatellia bacterium]